MSAIELIEYPTAAKAREALVRMYGDEDVEYIDIIDNGKTLRVTRSGDALPEEIEEVEPDAEDDATAGDLPGTEPVEGTPGVEEPDSGQEGQESDDESADEIDLNDYDRAGLRALVEELGLDMTIPQNTPLDDERDKVAAAINAANEED